MTINQILSQKNPLFSLYTPKSEKLIGVLSIPHSGEEVPPLFEEYLTSNIKERFEDVDTKVDHLVDIEKLQENGIAVIVSHIQRVCVDLNRAPEISVLNWKKNSKGKTLVTKEVSEKLQNELITKYHAPYFEMLKSLINNLNRYTKKASFIDLHSMPSRATEYHLKITPNQKIERPDFCVSNISGKSCEEDFINYVSKELQNSYKEINQNDPYFGGFITRHIDALFPEINNIQIEINRKNYLNEDSKELLEDKVKFMKPRLTDLLLKTYALFFERYKV